jgi:hypothetical protein
MVATTTAGCVISIYNPSGTLLVNESSMTADLNGFKHRFKHRLPGGSALGLLGFKHRSLGRALRRAAWEAMFEAVFEADRPSTCAVLGCQKPPTTLQVGPPTRWICPDHAAAELADARAAAATRNR